MATTQHCSWAVRRWHQTPRFAYNQQEASRLQNAELYVFPFYLNSLPFALDSLYLKRQKNSTDTRPKENGHLAIDIVNNIKQVMADHLRSDVQWMDPLTKSQAQEKLQAIEPIVGYPSYVMDYMAEKYLVQLDVDNSSYFDTSVQLLMKGRQVIMQGSTEINAFYSYDMNSIGNIK